MCPHLQKAGVLAVCWSGTSDLSHATCQSDQEIPRNTFKFYQPDGANKATIVNI